MGRHRAQAPAHPWRRVARTVLAVVPAFAALAATIYHEATQHDPAAATGAAGAALVVAGAITRVMANPGVERFLQRFAPWLAAEDVDARSVVAQLAPAPLGTHLDIVAGRAHPAPAGTPVEVPPALR